MKKSLLVFLVTGALGTFVATAAGQTVPGGGGPGGGPGADGPGGGGFGPPGSFRGPGRGGMAGLDDQQWQLFQEALQKDGAILRELEEKLRAAQKELLQAALASKYDEAAVRSKAEAMAKIQVEITMLRAGALALVARTMKPEQKQQLAESPSGIAMLSAGGPGGGGGGGSGWGGGLGAPGGFPGPGRGGMAGLDDQQRQLFQEALQKDGAKLRGLEEKLGSAQQDLLQATLDANYDEQTIRSKAEAMAKIQVEIIMMRAGALASVAPSMKPEQKQQLTESPFGMAMLSAGGLGGGGGPRRGFPNGGPGGFAPGGPGGGPGGAP